MVDVVVAVGTDVSRRLMEAERRRVKKTRWNKPTQAENVSSVIQHGEMIISTMKKGALGAGLRHSVLVLPEVEGSQTQADSSVWNLYRPIHHHNLTLLHRTRRPSLPANHKLT